MIPFLFSQCKLDRREGKTSARKDGLDPTRKVSQTEVDKTLALAEARSCIPLVDLERMGLGRVN